MYSHHCGPRNPILQYSGTKVLDPFQSNRLTEDEAIRILVIRDPRRNARNRDGMSLR